MRSVMLGLALAVSACGDLCTPGETRCVGQVLETCVLDHVDTSCYGDPEYQSCSTTPSGHWATTATRCGQQTPPSQPVTHG
jgi:hypothetical protein